MNKKLKRVLEEIQKTENKIAAWQEHLNELDVQKEQIENDEIIKSVRSMQLDSWSLLNVLDKINSGDISFEHCNQEETEEQSKVDVSDSASDSFEKIEETDFLSEGAEEEDEYALQNEKGDSE